MQWALLRMFHHRRSWAFAAMFGIPACVELSENTPHPAPPERQEPPDIVVPIESTSFLKAPTLRNSHRGINVNPLISRAVQWDSSYPGETGLPDAWGSPDLHALMRDLGISSIRIPGGTLANYYEFGADGYGGSNQSWVDWALDADEQFNSHGIDWDGFWSFYDAIGRPELITTANVYKNGGKSFDDWTSPDDAAEWARYYGDLGIEAPLFELGNEVYSDAGPQSQVYGMTYTASDDYSYSRRACAFASAIKQANSNAKTALVLTPKPKGAILLYLVENDCGFDDIDAFIVHDYAPGTPDRNTNGTYSFSEHGVLHDLAFQDMTNDVGTARAMLETHGQGAKPIYLTEVGLLFDIPGTNNWVSAWYDKPTTLLLANHLLDLIVSGADGLWFWEALSKYFRVVDADALTGARLYPILQQINAMRGNLVRLDATGSKTFSIDERLAIGCFRDEPDSECWGIAPEPSPTDEFSLVRAYAAYDESSSLLSVVLLNFGGENQAAAVDLAGFSATGVETTRLGGVHWDELLPEEELESEPLEDASELLTSVKARGVTFLRIDVRER